MTNEEASQRDTRLIALDRAIESFTGLAEQLHNTPQTSDFVARAKAFEDFINNGKTPE